MDLLAYLPPSLIIYSTFSPSFIEFLGENARTGAQISYVHPTSRTYADYVSTSVRVRLHTYDYVQCNTRTIM